MCLQEIVYRVWWEDLRERDHLEDLEVGERAILKWISSSGMVARAGPFWVRIGARGELL